MNDGDVDYDAIADAEYDEYQHDRTARYHKHRTPNHHHHAGADHFHDYYGESTGWEHHDHDTKGHRPTRQHTTREDWASLHGSE